MCFICFILVIGSYASRITSIMFMLLFICFSIMIVFYVFIIASAMLVVKIQLAFIYFYYNGSVCCCFSIACTLVLCCTCYLSKYYVLSLYLQWHLFLILPLLALFFIFFTSTFPTENGYGEFTAAIFSCEV